MAELFQPGPVAKGTIVTYNGIEWVSDVDIKYASAPPRDGQYWTRVSAITPVLIADGVTDYLPIIQGMIDKITLYGEIKVPTGEYYFSGTITWFNKIILAPRFKRNKFYFLKTGFNGNNGLTRNRLLTPFPEIEKFIR